MKKIIKTTRPIKFRAWDKEKSEWIDMSTLRFAIDGQTRIADMPPSRYNLLQYTGLKDKNEIDVYEGDIVKDYYGKPAIVVWIDSGMWGVKYSKRAKTWCDMNYVNGYSLWKVIGNIYESKHLLDNTDTKV